MKYVYSVLFIIAVLQMAGCNINFHFTSEAEQEGAVAQTKTIATQLDKAVPEHVPNEKLAVEVTKIKEVDGVNIILNPDNIAALVNKQYTLPADYKPEDLVIPDIPFSFSGEHEKKYLRKEAAIAAEKLFAKAKEENIDLVAASGYRSYARQQSIFQAKVNAVGEQLANEVVAVPGESEHQTGLALDVTTAEMSFLLEEEFGDTKEGIWLQENAHHFGFIIRYPKDKEHITGYSYEPWHLRYVGVELATALNETNLVLEEYLLDSIEVVSQDPAAETAAAE